MSKERREDARGAGAGEGGGRERKNTKRRKRSRQTEGKREQKEKGGRGREGERTKIGEERAKETARSYRRDHANGGAGRRGREGDRHPLCYGRDNKETHARDNDARGTAHPLIKVI